MFRDKFPLVCPSCQCLRGFAPVCYKHIHTYTPIRSHTVCKVYSFLPCQMCRSCSPSHRASETESPPTSFHLCQFSNSPLAATISSPFCCTQSRVDTFTACSPAPPFALQLSQELKLHLNQTMTANYGQPGRASITVAVDRLQQDVRTARFSCTVQQLVAAHKVPKNVPDEERAEHLSSL